MMWPLLIGISSLLSGFILVSYGKWNSIAYGILFFLVAVLILRKSVSYLKEKNEELRNHDSLWLHLFGNIFWVLWGLIFLTVPVILDQERNEGIFASVAIGLIITLISGASAWWLLKRVAEERIPSRLFEK